MAWCVAMRIMARVEDLVQRTEDGRTCRVLGGRAIERSGGAVCDLYRAHGMRSTSFLLSLKTKVVDLSVVWPQTYWVDLSVVWPQNH
jgi:hypothetical protein